MRYLVSSNGRALRPMAFVNDFDRMLDSFFSDVPYWDSQVPKVDIHKEEGQYVLSAELPGYSQENLDIKVEGNLLTISAENQKETEENDKEKKYLVKERLQSSFKRSFVLPKDVDSEKIEAAFKDGILTLTMQVSEKSQPKSISIK